VDSQWYNLHYLAGVVGSLRHLAAVDDSLHYLAGVVVVAAGVSLVGSPY